MEKGGGGGKEGVRGRGGNVGGCVEAGEKRNAEWAGGGGECGVIHRVYGRGSPGGAPGEVEGSQRPLVMVRMKMKLKK